jgi:polyhydroxyalkanoate synthesis repressor PhaR
LLNLLFSAKQALPLQLQPHSDFSKILLTFIVRCTIFKSVNSSWFVVETLLRVMSTRIIKRYKNRRLYDSEERRTIKLENLVELIKKDVDFKVIDSRTKKDVTLSVLTKVLSESITENKKNLKQTSNLIRLLIVRGGEITVDFFEKSILFGLGLFDLTKEKAEKLVDEMIKRGEMSQSDKAKAVKELLKGHDERMEKLKTKIDESVEKITAKVKGKEKEDLAKLHQKLDDLAKVVEKLEKKLSEK